jgi:hypothetical protein
MILDIVGTFALIGITLLIFKSFITSDTEWNEECRKWERKERAYQFKQKLKNEKRVL